MHLDARERLDEETFDVHGVEIDVFFAHEVVFASVQELGKHGAHGVPVERGHAHHPTRAVQIERRELELVAAFRSILMEYNL